MATDGFPRSLENWTPCPPLQRERLDGRFVCIEPLDEERHARSLFTATVGEGTESFWEYLWEGPYTDLNGCKQWVRERQNDPQTLFFAVVDKQTGEARGRLALMRIEPAHGVAEVGHVQFGLGLRKTPGATESLRLLARYVFEDKGYRRFEWKCDARNIPSRQAALRFGFSFEGIFRQHMVYKSRNRDTAWFSIIDSEWPERRAAFDRWLAPENFDVKGRQCQPLSHFMLQTSA